MNVVVFGATGFLGSHVADALSEAGHSVRLFDIKPSPYIKPGQTMIVGDILDSDAVNNAIQGCEFVYNFAGLADLDDSCTKPIDTIKLNILGNTLILDSCANSGCKRFIYASSVYVYSEKGGFYRCSKQAAELYIEEFQRRYGLNYTILRYGTLYGPRSDERNSVFRYLHQALIDKRIRVSATGDELREYIHVKDAAALSVDILDEKYAGKYVTITGHHGMRFRDLLLTIREILGGTVEIDFAGNSNNAHYEFTPYSYLPKIGYKLTSNLYVDMGQGLLECLAEIHQRIENNEIKGGLMTK